ncbi:MAG: DUF2802 domain-containing protein [Gammaproteobacteria bacterium]|nr:DUF2802 domain-containing protein [Gammaproteobacteria bacterium]
MNILIAALGLAVAGVSVIALVALRRVSQLSQRCVELEKVAVIFDERLQFIEVQNAQFSEVGAEFADRVERLSVRQAREQKTSEKSGFNEAIALIEHGADIDELIEACGISRAEAQLVQTLYGKGETETPLDRQPSKFVLIEEDRTAA